MFFYRIAYTYGVGSKIYAVFFMPGVIGHIPDYAKSETDPDWVLNGSKKSLKGNLSGYIHPDWREDGLRII